MSTQDLWSSIRTDLRRFFTWEHLRISGEFYVYGLAAWLASIWLGHQSIWEGILETVAVLYMSLAGICAMLVTLAALPAMRLAGSFEIVSKQSNWLAWRAFRLSRLTFTLGAVAIGVLCAQLTVACSTMDNFDWRIGIMLVWIVVALGAMVCLNGVMWLTARTLDVEHRDSPLLRAIQSLPLTTYIIGWIVCMGIIVGIVLFNGL